MIIFRDRETDIFRHWRGVPTDLESDHFSWQTDRQTHHHNIYIIITCTSFPTTSLLIWPEIFSICSSIFVWYLCCNNNVFCIYLFPIINFAICILHIAKWWSLYDTCAAIMSYLVFCVVFLHFLFHICNLYFAFCILYLYFRFCILYLVFCI